MLLYLRCSTRSSTTQSRVDSLISKLGRNDKEGCPPQFCLLNSTKLSSEKLSSDSTYCILPGTNESPKASAAVGGQSPYLVATHLGVRVLLSQDQQLRKRLFPTLHYYLPKGRSPTPGNHTRQLGDPISRRSTKPAWPIAAGEPRRLDVT